MPKLKYFFFDSRVPDLKSMKACQGCKIEVVAKVFRLKALKKEMKEHGITQAVVAEFVQETLYEHDESMIVVLTSFIGALSQGQFKEGAEEASKRFVSQFINVEFAAARKMEKAMTPIVDRNQCKWHTMGFGIDDEDATGDDGPVPPESSGPSMFG